MTPDIPLMARTVAAAAADRTTKVRFELFAGVTVEVPTLTYQERANGFSWGGTGIGPNGTTQTVSLTSYRPTPREAAGGMVESVTGEFWSGDAHRYQLQAVAGAVHVIAELDQGALWDEHGRADGGPDGQAGTGASVPPALMPSPGSSPSSSAPPMAAASDDGLPHFVDVMVVHTQLGAAAVGQVEGWVNQANMANAASGVPFTFRVVDVRMVDYTEHGNMHSDLTWVETSNEVAAARRAVSADLVVMIVGGTGYANVCGKGQVPGAFSVVNAAGACDTLTMAHEMGHNFGLHHDAAHDDLGTPSPPYARGFLHPQARFRTIMAYNDPQACLDGNCMHVDRWSDPNLTYQTQDGQVPMGVPNEADNARALREGWQTVEGYMVPPELPEGAYDSATQANGGVLVQGWAIDFDTPTTPVWVHIYDNGSLVGAYLASKPREDLPRYWPNAGSAHGFSEVLTLGEGGHSVCVYAIDTAYADRHTGLGCKSISIRVEPFGSFETVERSPGGGWVSGWAVEPDLGTAPGTVTAYVTGNPTPTSRAANGHREDLNSLGYGPDHGFSFAVQAAAGSQQFCVWAENVGAGSAKQLGCQSVTLVSDPVGAVTYVARAPGGVRVAGWAVDPDVAEPTAVRFSVDGVPVMADAASKPGDAGGGYSGYGPNHGYSTVVPVPPGAHRVCVVGVNLPHTPGADAQIGGCSDVTIESNPIGSVDGIGFDSPSSFYVGGWALDFDSPAAIVVRVTVDGAPIPVPAATNRPDIASTWPEYGPNHGFSNSIPVTPGPHSVCVTAANVGAGADTPLGCWDLGGNAGPFGNFEYAQRVAPTVGELGGWAIDADAYTTSIPVRATVDGTEVAAALASSERQDVGGAYPAAGPNHGFTLRVPLTLATHTVCVIATNVGPGRDTNLGCRSV